MILKYAFIFITASQIVLAKPAKEDYLLPKFCKPLEYHIDIDVPLISFSKSYNVFHGYEMIKFYLNKTTNYIALHSHHSYIRVTSIMFRGAEIPSNSSNVDEYTDILKIHFESPIHAGKTYLITIRYEAILSTRDLYGLYKRTYTDEHDKERYFLATMFAPTHARRVFPCFDEPSWKASFSIAFSIPLRYGVRFNTPQEEASFHPDLGVKYLKFVTTPKMSTYLLAFVISDFTCTSAGQSDELAVTRVCSRDTAKDKRALAVEYAPRLLHKMGELTDRGYERLLEQLEHVAIPHFDDGAMENWGLIFYKERNLLWQDDSNRDMQRIVTTIAHEISHQWFGNLVTNEWWSEVFVNEGFAAYFEYYLTNEILPEWELDKQFVIEKMHAALTNDAFASAPVLQSNCYTPDEIKNKFHELNYDKGSSIIRMIEHFMKRENFIAGLQYYIKTYQFRTATVKDLWLALNRSVDQSISQLPANFTTVMQNWTGTTGFPLITVSMHEDKVTISQKRYPFSGDDASTNWYVPISYSLSVDTDKFQNTTPKLWLTPFTPSADIALPINTSWIIFNNQQSAYYRVMYDKKSLDNIVAGLAKDNFDGIGELNRAKIVDDLFSLAKINFIGYSTVFKSIQFLKNDTSYFSWYAAFEGFEFLLQKVGYDSAVGVMVKNITLELMQSLFDSVLLSNMNEEDQVYTLKEVMAHQWACKLNFRYCNNLAALIFKQYQHGCKKPLGNYRRIVYCHGVEYSKNKCDWDFLWESYSMSNSESEKEAMLYGLPCTNDESIIKKLLLMTIDEKYGFTHDSAFVIYSQLSEGRDRGIHLLLNFLMDNHIAVAIRYGILDFGLLLESIATRVFTMSQMKTYKALVEIVSPQFKIYGDLGLMHIDKSFKFIHVVEKELLGEKSKNSAELKIASGIVWVTFVPIVLGLYS